MILGDAFLARQFLARYERDPFAIATMREALRERGLLGPTDGGHADVIEAVAHHVLSGRLVLARRLLPRAPAARRSEPQEPPPAGAGSPAGSLELCVVWEDTGARRSLDCPS